MKYLTLLSTIVIIFLNCTKDDTAGIAGNWSIINDSVYSSIGIIANMHNYKGLNSDYFNFSSNGKLYIKENTLFDTLNYQLLSNNRIIIDSISLLENGEYVPSQITLLTANKVSIKVVSDLNPGGTYARFINLSR